MLLWDGKLGIAFTCGALGCVVGAAQGGRLVHQDLPSVQPEMLLLIQKLICS